MTAMADRTMRCEVCKAKTSVALDAAQLETFSEAMDLGIQEGRWELYWALAEEVAARCFVHEGFVRKRAHGPWVPT